MRTWFIAAQCLLLGTATAVNAADPAPAGPTAPVIILAAPAATLAAPVASQEIICRKEKETGSLVKSKKTCHSRAQWAYIDDTNQSFSRDLADQTRTKSGGN